MSPPSAVATTDLIADAGHPLRRPRLATLLRWELRKLAAQRRTLVGLLLAMLPSLIFVAFWKLDHAPGRAAENIFAREITSSGLAVPVLMLIFESALLIPIFAALVAGDIFAAEDGNGTLKTILTRSADRGQIFAAKVLAAFAYALLVLLAAVTLATLAGVAGWGLHPLGTLSGNPIPAGKMLALIYLGAICYLLPLFAVASFGLLLSVLTRNSAGSVLTTVALLIILVIVARIPGLEAIQPYLVTEQFQAWQGVLRTPSDWAPIAHSAWLCALYALPSLAVAYVWFLRRDVAGG